jgi:hypothetical protein
MNATTLLKELRGRGVELASDGEQLRYRPRKVITPELPERLKTHKREVLNLLARERHDLTKADRRSLIIRWSEFPTWISLHDPTTGEWHEVTGLRGVCPASSRPHKRTGRREAVRHEVLWNLAEHHCAGRDENPRPRN